MWPGRTVCHTRMAEGEIKWAERHEEGRIDGERQPHCAVRLLSLSVFCLRQSPKDVHELEQTWEWLKGLPWAVLAPTGDGP